MRLRAPPLTLATGAAAALPIASSTIRALAERWYPFADQGIIATRAYDVPTLHTPLVGQYSYTSELTGHATYSLGPLLYWALALPARVGPLALPVAVGALNAGAVLMVVWLARRRGGMLLMFLTAAGLALMSAAHPSEIWHDVWNPSASLLPFTLLVFLCWSLAAGELRLLPPTALVASFVLQCHLVYLPATAAIVALAALAVARRRPSRRIVAATLAVVAVAWSPPLVDELTRQPGNATLVARASFSSHASVGLATGLRAVVLAVGVPPWWLESPADQFQRSADVANSPPLLSTLTALLVVAALVALVVRRRRLDEPAAFALACIAALALAVAATPASLRNTLGYTLWWATPVGMFAWVVLAWRLLERFPVPRPTLAPAAGLAVTLVAGVAVAAAQGPDVHRSFYGPTRTLADALVRTLPSGGTVNLTGDPSIVRTGLRYALRRHGVRPLGLAPARIGHWYDLDHRRYAYTISLGLPAPGARVVAHTRFEGAPVSVSIKRSR